jgi:hypothetical protein
LKILNNAICEIARENGTAEFAASELLFRWIEKMHGIKLRARE